MQGFAYVMRNQKRENWSGARCRRVGRRCWSWSSGTDEHRAGDSDESGLALTLPGWEAAQFSHPQLAIWWLHASASPLLTSQYHLFILSSCGED